MRAKPGDQVVIIGAGHAGGRAAQHLRKSGFGGPILVVGEETSAPYERPALSKEILMGTQSPADLLLQPEHQWREAGIELVLSTSVRHVERAGRVVHLSEGRCFRSTTSSSRWEERLGDPTFRERTIRES